MAAPKRPTHELLHARYYTRVEDKIVHVPQGTQLTLTPEQADKMGKMVKSLSNTKSLDLSVKKEEK